MINYNYDETVQMHQNQNAAYAAQAQQQQQLQQLTLGYMQQNPHWTQQQAQQAAQDQIQLYDLTAKYMQSNPQLTQNQAQQMATNQIAQVKQQQLQQQQQQQQPALLGQQNQPVATTYPSLQPGGDVIEMQQMNSHRQSAQYGGTSGTQIIEQPKAKKEVIKPWRKQKSFKERRIQCRYQGCTKISPYKCKATVLCQEFGCGKNFCDEHKGNFGLLFFQKVNFNDEDVSYNQEALCFEHIDGANQRTYCVFGCPFVLLILASLICLVIDIMGIASAFNDVSFEPVRETYYLDGEKVEAIEPEREKTDFELFCEFSGGCL